MELSSDKHRKKAIERAEKKIIDGLTLSGAEQAAIDGKWFFTVCLPTEVIGQILALADKSGVKPGDIVSAWVMKGLIREGS